MNTGGRRNRQNLNRPESEINARDKREDPREQEKTGTEYYKSGRYEDAVEIFTRILKINPDDPRIYN